MSTFTFKFAANIHHDLPVLALDADDTLVNTRSWFTKLAVAAGANEALADVVKGVAEGKKAVVSGFHDATGDAALNAELAKQRAVAVAEALKALGVAEDKVELKKPEETTATGSNAEARRVEVTLGGL